MNKTTKYGLQIRVQPQQKKQSVKPPLPNPLGFEDGDDDNFEREILRQAYKNKSHKDVEEQHKKALEEDPSTFDYDGVYDKMKEKQVQPMDQDRKDRKQPRYIQTLMDKAKQREREHEIIYERKLAKERSKDEDLYADKDKFVTGAYKRKLAEQAKWLEEERLREMREEKEDVTKKTDLTDFYFNLAKNVAFGAGDANSQKLQKQPEAAGVPSPAKISPRAIDSSSKLARSMKRHQNENAEIPSTKQKSEQAHSKPISDASLQTQAAIKSSASDLPRDDHHKRSEDAVAAAKARFLARKKAKVP